MPSWTTPVDHVTGYTVTATDWDNFFGANGDLAFLFGDTGWTAVSGFTNSWVAGSTTPRFILIGRTVFMNGLIQSGTINTAAFTLPAGYRPSALVRLPTVANSAFGAATISTAGVYTPVVGSTTGWAIDGSFSVV